MKKHIIKILVVIIILCILIFIICKPKKKEEKNILDIVEEKVFYVNKYFIFGSHFNIEGYIDEVIDDELKLVLKNNDNEIEVSSTFNTLDSKTYFNTAKNNNEGIYLDGIDLGEYYLFVKQINNEGEKYYSLQNETQYNNLEYYTITKDNKNNKIQIYFDDNKNLKFDIEETSLPDNVYDIAIDPGHGGKDSGSLYEYKSKTYKESDLVLEVALQLKETLEKKGYKVIITRTTDKTLESFDENDNIGRASVANEAKAKYSFSLHLNSYHKEMNYGGVEVYTPNDIDLTLASSIASNISNVVGYSKKETNRIKDGVYYEYLTEKDVKEYDDELREKGLKPYDMVIGSPYMYMIRELGGIVTNAYMDGRNEEHGYNKYVKSNQVAEAYLLELCYINYKQDFLKVLNNPDEFAKEISNAIDDYLNK